MNILFVMPWDQAQGGVTHVAASLARSLQARGHRAYFMFPGTDWLLRRGTSRQGFPSIECRFRDYPADRTIRARLSWSFTAFTTLPQLIRFARTYGIDLVNVHYPVDGFALLVDLAQRLRVPLVVSAHGSDLLTDRGPCRDAGLMRLLERASAVVVPSRTYLGSVVEAYPGIQGTARYIYNGYDERELGQHSELSSNAPGAATVALCIAALIHKKGIDVLLCALQACATRDLTLRLIGDGPLRPELEALSTGLGLEHRVSFLGQQNRTAVFDELRRCDLVVMSSRHASESFGLATLEAMACGRPVVASAIGGLQELVSDQETGLLVPPEDPLALARALDCLAADPALRTRMGEAGRRRAQRFTVKATADGYEALFTGLIEGANEPAGSRAAPES